MDFKHLQCDVLSKLKGVYCLDVYGSQLCNYVSSNCFNNSNTIVQIIVIISMKNRESVLGINFRYLAFNYKIKSNYWHENWKYIERSIFTYAETTRSDSDYYVGNTIRELWLTHLLTLSLIQLN